MTKKIAKQTTGADMAPLAHRRLMFSMLAIGLLAPLGACGKGSKRMGKEINLSVVMYSYMPRPIIDVMFNGEDLGVSGPYGTTGIITGVHIPFGPQSLHWRLDGPEGTPNNGDTIRVKNALTLSPDQISSSTRYLGLHIYPDFTAEIMLCDDMPEISPRGKQLLKKREPYVRY
jgi:hypothetical protein